jgi:hypothetical protein
MKYLTLDSVTCYQCANFFFMFATNDIDLSNIYVNNINYGNGALKTYS